MTKRNVLFTMLVACCIAAIAMAQEQAPPAQKMPGKAGAALFDAVKVGEMAPDFTLKTLDGQDFTLSSLRTKKYVVMQTGSST